MTFFTLKPVESMLCSLDEDIGRTKHFKSCKKETDRQVKDQRNPDTFKVTSDIEHLTILAWNVFVRR